MSLVLKAEHISKQYRLGQIGTGTLSHDLKRWFYSVRGKEDPFLQVGDVNDRTTRSDQEYVWALKDINVDIHQGDVVGIIGKNGAGKSTLLKLLSRVTAPSTGTIKIKGRIAALLEVGTGFHPELTGRENIYLNGAILGMRKREITSKLDAIIDFSGCNKYIDTPVKRYSSGMLVRLGFAVAAHLDPEILIVDEVLAVGDAEFQDRCIRKMKDVSGEGRTVLFVSHNMASMKALCKRGILMENGRIAFQGSMQETIEKYLATAKKASYSGEIPADASSINTGVVKFRKLVLLDHTNAPVSSVNYLDSIQLYIELESNQNVDDCIIDVRINTMDGLELVHAMNQYVAKPGDGKLTKGLNKVYCRIENHLQPGRYSLTMGVHQLNGLTLEYVENIVDFSVLTVSSGDANGFVYNFQMGYIRFESAWKIENPM